MFRKVLVANRGEIAVRILRTLHEMGIRSVAVYSEADVQAPHVRLADEAYLIGPSPPLESYLRIDRVLEIARRAGADAIHPGYGFLSENPQFARACREAGITFIGPSAEAMAAVGDKAAARRIAIEQGVPVIPGVHDCDTPVAVRAAAQKIGLPVLLKAAAGGGGRGMRRVLSEDELDEAIAGAQREALASFGDGRLIVEKFLPSVRHVEVQVLGDRYGNVVALGERDCSLQRRYQKVIEEAPSPALDAALRERLLEAARRIATAVRYENAGTVEFLVDLDGRFYFLEFNTRLQVEHPVTEMVTGLDLVRLQVEVAAGAPVRLPPEGVPFRGHAIEARLYAEDPERQFLPSTGTVLFLRWPQGPGLRVDTGLEEGLPVAPYYDPMVAKLIAWGPDREQARRRLVRALQETVVLGVRTNQSFLIRLLESPEFRSGRVLTSTIDVRSWVEPQASLPEWVWVAAGIALYHAVGPGRRVERSGRYTSVLGPEPYSPWRTLGRWRLLES